MSTPNQFAIRITENGADLVGGTSLREVIRSYTATEQTGFGSFQDKREKAIKLARGSAKHLNRMFASGYSLEHCLNYYKPQPSPAAVELALAEEKANQEKISATVQAARASATQPQQVKGHNPRLANDWYNLIQDDPRHAATVASSTCRRLLAERDELGSMCAEWSVKHDDICKTLERLQAQRDELLAACRLAHAALTDHGRWLPDEYQQAAHACSAAIARATSKQGQAK